MVPELMIGHRAAYDVLVQKLGTTTGPPGLKSPSGLQSGQMSTTVTLNSEDYKMVTIWKLEHWQKHPRNARGEEAGIRQSSARNKSKDLNGARNSLFYIQDTSGNLISEAKASELCHHARTIWEYLATLGVAPAKWKRCSAPAADYYRQEMYRFCPDLHLCEGHWKVDRLATDTYPSWNRNRVNNITPKVEAKQEEVPSSFSVTATSQLASRPSPEPMKRKEPPCCSLPPVAEKRIKTSEFLQLHCPLPPPMYFPHFLQLPVQPGLCLQ